MDGAARLDARRGVFREFEGTLHSIHHDMQSGQFYGLQGYGLDSTWVSWGGDEGYWH